MKSDVHGLPLPPRGLSELEADAWGTANLMFAFRRRPEALAALAACWAATQDVIRLETALAEAPALVPGTKGRFVPNPLFAEVRAARTALDRLLARYRELLPEDEQPERYGMEKSNLGRQLARARWTTER